MLRLLGMSRWSGRWDIRPGTPTTKLRGGTSLFTTAPAAMKLLSEFERECIGVRLFVLPPRSPKLNGHVERAQRTHIEEFYEIYDGDLEVGPLNRALRHWEQVYNTVRPHQSLGYLTPKSTSDAPARPEFHEGPRGHNNPQAPRPHPPNTQGDPPHNTIIGKEAMCTGCTERVQCIDTNARCGLDSQEPSGKEGSIRAMPAILKTNPQPTAAVDSIPNLTPFWSPYEAAIDSPQRHSLH